MYEKVTLCLLVVVGIASGFLIQDSSHNKSSLTQVSSSSQQTTQDLLSIIVEEKRLRYQLETAVTTLDTKINQMESKINQMDQFNSEVSNELKKERNNRQLLETMYNGVRTELENVTHMYDTVSNGLMEESNNRQLLETMYNGMRTELENVTNTCVTVSNELKKETNNQHILETMYNEIRTEFENVTRMYDSVQVENKHLATRLERLEAELNKSNNYVLERLPYVESQMDVLNLTLQNARLAKSTNGSAVGFSVYYPDGSSSGNPLIFTDTVYNADNVFNMSSGKFVCRQEGLYYFVNTMIRFQISKTTAYCYFYKNDRGSSYVAGYADSTSAGHNPSGTNSILYYLKSGDQVYLGNCRGISNMDHSSSFTGFLVSQVN